MTATAAFVLPPREVYSADGAGAISLLVHRLAAHPSAFRQVVVGPAVAGTPLGAEFVAVRPSWLPGSRNRRYAGGVARALRALGPALVEVHNRPDLALFLATRLPGVPVGLFLNNDPQGMREARTAAERHALMTRLSPVVASSSWLVGRLLAGVDAPFAPVVLPNSLDLATLPPPAMQRDPVILFAGRIVRDKGADSFVRAWARARARLPGWRAEMIGADRFGPDSPDTAFLRALRPEAVAAGVAMLGWRPHVDVVAAMARAAVVVVPSRWDEPFGLTAVEAMATGAALLCSMRGGLAEVVGDAAEAIDPDDPDAMSAAFVAVASDPARRARLAETGLARAARYDVPVVAARLARLRSDVLAEWPRRAARPI